MIDNNASIEIGKEFINDYYSDKPVLRNSDKSVKRIVQLQDKRLKNNNISLIRKYSERGHFYQGNVARVFSSEHYYHTMSYYTIQSSIEVNTTKYKNLYKHKQNEIFYTYITDSKDYQVSKNDSYCCPNCGAVSTIEQLTDKCPYCSTHFDIKELYPKVSCFYGLLDFGGTEKEIKMDIFKYIIPTCSICLLMFIIGFKSLLEQGVFFLIFDFVAMMALSAMFGYIIWAFLTLGSLFTAAFESIPLLFALNKTKKFTEDVRKYDDSFSMEYFIFKLVAYVKELIFSDNDTSLPFYLGKENKLYSNVIDSIYRGAINVKDYSIKNNKVKVKVVVYMNNLHYKNSKVFNKKDDIEIYVEKDLSKPFDYDFSINAINCKSCGGSFDGYTNNNCPYCGNEYNIADFDWVITDIQKK